MREGSAFDRHTLSNQRALRLLTAGGLLSARSWCRVRLPCCPSPVLLRPGEPFRRRSDTHIVATSDPSRQAIMLGGCAASLRHSRRRGLRDAPQDGRFDAHFLPDRSGRASVLRAGVHPLGAAFVAQQLRHMRGRQAPISVCRRQSW
jgi:hypothetical protein